MPGRQRVCGVVSALLSWGQDSNVRDSGTWCWVMLGVQLLLPVQFGGWAPALSCCNTSGALCDPVTPRGCGSATMMWCGLPHTVFMAREGLLLETGVLFPAALGFT